MKGTNADRLTNFHLYRYRKTVFQKLMGFWDWLITPLVEINQPDILRQARLLSAMLVVLVSLGFLVEAFTLKFANSLGYSDGGLALWILLLLGLAFYLNRAGRFSAAVWIAVIIQSIAIFAVTFYDSQPIEVGFLTFLVIPLLFSSIFLSERMILVLAGFYLGAMSLASVFIPGVNLIVILDGPGSFVVVSCGLIYVMNRHRNVLEADRQRELVEKEERYRTLLETSYEGICILAGEKIIDANPNFARMFGYKLSELVGESVMKIMPQEHQSGVEPSLHNMKGHPSKIPVYSKDGSAFYIDTVSKMQTYRGEPAQVIAIRDVTERVQAEEALDRNERLYRSLFEGANDAIFLLSFENIHITANQKAADMLGYAVPELVGKGINEVVVPRQYPDSMKVKAALLAGEIVPLYERKFCKKDGTEFPVEVNVSLVHDQDGRPSCIQSIVRDISERKHTESRLERQLERLNALREIDRMITSSLDIKLTLKAFLSHVAAQLGVDATDVLLLNPELNYLEYSGDRGFNSELRMREPLNLNEKLAGRAVLERRRVSIADLDAEAEHSQRLGSLARQGFLSGFAVPLIAKGQVKGVLEVFHRNPFEPTEEWIDFLETLAGQAAIAIDSAQLFQNLQRSNRDLIWAYDATLEGWAKALELRDKETEGHSQRVTEMTMRLARFLGIKDAELVHLRRGALLHDIGKMGIPDSILLKPGPLTEEEWEIMKQHPVYAKEMLSSIPFLSPALEIPYHHHERWDGSGYPLGLKGRAIPLPARIFAVVDVWDALTSDRPYRKRWTQVETLDYIQAQSGIQFDPIVVTTLLDLVDQGA